MSDEIFDGIYRRRIGIDVSVCDIDGDEKFNAIPARNIDGECDRQFSDGSAGDIFDRQKFFGAGAIDVSGRIFGRIYDVLIVQHRDIDIAGERQRIGGDIECGIELGIGIAGSVVGGAMCVAVMYNEERCVRCGLCVSESEYGGVRMIDGRIMIDESRAEDWAMIASICPTGAIEVDDEELS